MSDDKSHELGNLDDLEEGEMRVFEDIGDYGIVVCRVNGELYALEDNCSHADTPLVRDVYVLTTLPALYMEHHLTSEPENTADLQHMKGFLVSR